jgi:DNA-binding CsgD family transcriptional regulator
VVVTACDEQDPAEVFDVVARLVDKSLVVAEEGPRGEPRYKLLQTLQAYALEEARAAGELVTLRDANSVWWSTWLERRLASPDDETLDDIDDFHDNLVAAIEWSTGNPAVGLTLLGRLATVWQGADRAVDAVLAGDALLTDDNAQHYSRLWLTAAEATAPHYLFVRGQAEYERLVRRLENVALLLGDDYRVELARSLLNQDANHGAALLDRARQLGDPYGQALAAVITAEALSDTDPTAALSYLERHETVVAASSNLLLRGYVARTRARVAHDTGDLATCIELARSLTESRSALIVFNGLILLAQAGLLTRDLDALAHAVATAGETRTSDHRIAAEGAVAETHRRYIAEDQSSQTDPAFGVEPMSTGSTWLCAKEAIDAGDSNLALAVVQGAPQAGPFPQAVAAAIEAAVNDAEDRWHDALTVAVDHHLRLIVVDALEGLAVAAAATEAWIEALRLLGASERLREETGYRWRFRFEETAVSTARSTALGAVGRDGQDVIAAGRNLEWQSAAAFARRARGDRKRPRHGWGSLTPTENEVVALVVDGLTNPQIAESLLMGRATVKTHLEHIFTKVGIRTRAELAAEAVRRTSG